MINTNPPPCHSLNSFVLKIKPSSTPKIARATPKTYILTSISCFARSLFSELAIKVNCYSKVLSLFQESGNGTVKERKQKIPYCRRCDLEFLIPLTRCPKCKGKISYVEEGEIYEE